MFAKLCVGYRLVFFLFVKVEFDGFQLWWGKILKSVTQFGGKYIRRP